MEDRSRPWLALLISALVHVVVALVLFGQAGQGASRRGSSGEPGRALMVSFVSAALPAAHATEPLLASAGRREPSAEPHSAPAKDAKAGDGNAQHIEHHYFGASEVSRQAVVVEGLVNDVLLVVPGLLPQEVSLQVWISDEGTVDRVELESAMPEDKQQLLLAAFAKVRFLPGRIGHIAVHSRVSMKILVDYAIRA